MVVKVSLYNNSKNQSIVLSNQDITIIGRGFFECEDKRVSKRHGEITVIDATIKVRSCHTNPIFYVLKDDPNKKILRKNSEIILGDSDKFSLLPDEFEWTVKVEQDSNNNDQNPTSTFRIRQTEEINANLTQLLRDGQMTPENPTDDPERTPSPDNLRRPETLESGITSSSRKRSCEDAEVTDSKRSKPAVQVPSSTTTLPVEIKPDPDSSSAQPPAIPTTSTVKSEPVDDQPTSSSTTEQKSEPNEVKTEADDDGGGACCQGSNSLRPSCEFGIRCYRMTDEHQREYAHPMDCDYRRPNLPPAPADAPRCPYWDGCYRRNPEHFREMQHPPADQYVTQRPPQIQIRLQQVAQLAQIPISPRNQQRNRRNRNITQSDQDFDDMDDLSDELFDDGDDSDLDADFNGDFIDDDDEDDLDEEENNLEE